MEDKKHLQLVNLETFLNLFYRPAQARMEAWQRAFGQTDPSPEVDLYGRRLADIAASVQLGGFGNHSRASLWEAYLWLHLGAEIGFFPMAESEEFMRRSIDTFPEYYSAYQTMGDLFPGRLQSPLSAAFHQRKYFARSIGNGLKEGDPVQDVVFQNLLLFQTSFADDGVAQYLVEGLAFQTGTRWNWIMAEPTDSTKLTAWVSYPSAGDPGKTGKETAMAGFFRVVAYLAQFRFLLEGAGSIPRSIHSDEQQSRAKTLGQRVKEICFWRLNFLRRGSKQRFLELAQSAAVTVVQELRSLEPSAKPDLADFMKQVSELTEFWTRGIEMDVTATATG